MIRNMIRKFFVTSRCDFSMKFVIDRNFICDIIFHFQVYIYLSKLLRHCILTKSQSTVIVQGPVGDPPFELPDIQKIVSNFVFLKYGHLRDTSKLDFQIYTELAKNLLHCINCWDFEAPRDRKDPMSTEEASSYKINYTRWLIFCWVPGKLTIFLIVQ